MVILSCNLQQRWAVLSLLSPGAVGAAPVVMREHHVESLQDPVVHGEVLRRGSTAHCRFRKSVCGGAASGRKWHVRPVELRAGRLRKHGLRDTNTDQETPTLDLHVTPQSERQLSPVERGRWGRWERRYQAANTVWRRSSPDPSEPQTPSESKHRDMNAERLDQNGSGHR